MGDGEATLRFAETLIYDKTGAACSELQRHILLVTLQGERKTYEQLADECGYSAKYVKGIVAPKLWHALSEVLDQKVTKSNVRFLLEKAMGEKAIDKDASLSQSAPSVESPTSPAESAADTPSSSASLPRIDTEVEASENRSSPTESKSLTSARILLVDDQPKNLRLLSDLLEEQGYKVFQALNGAIALEAIALEKPDLILLDIHMPEMDGYTVCQRLKANTDTQDIPVIFVSALDEVWDKVRAFSVGGSDYINKPFKVVEVLARVENQLKVRQLQQALAERNRQLQEALDKLQQLSGD